MRGKAELQPVLDRIKSKAEGAGAAATASAAAPGDETGAEKKPYEFQPFHQCVFVTLCPGT